MVDEITYSQIPYLVSTKWSIYGIFKGFIYRYNDHYKPKITNLNQKDIEYLKDILNKIFNKNIKSYLDLIKFLERFN